MSEVKHVMKSEVRLQTERFIQSALCRLHGASIFSDVDQEHDVGQYLIEYLKCDNNTKILLHSTPHCR